MISQMNKIRCTLFVMLVVVMLLPAAHALTWQEALSLADKNNNQINSARRQADSSYWSYNKAMTNFLPQVSANLGASKSDNKTTSTISKAYSYGLSATQTIFKGFQNYFSLISARIQYEYDKAGLDNTKANVFYDLRTAFTDVFIAQETIKVQEKILARRKENAKLIDLRYKSGIEDKGNMMLTKANEVQSQHDLNSAKRSLELAKLNLSQMIEASVDAVEISIIPDKTVKLDVDKVMVSAPTYIMAQKQLDSADINKKATISEFLPNVSVSGSLSKSGSSWPPSTDSNSLSLSMSYSLFPGGSNITDAYINSINYDKALQDFENNKQTIRYGLESAVSNFADAIEALSASNTIFAAKAERAKINQARYMNGLVRYDEWDRIENDAINASMSLLSNKRNSLYSEAALYKSYGGWIK